VEVFYCGQGKCIPTHYVCDTDNDCGDDSDEENCDTYQCDEETQIKCDENRCLMKRYMCDGDSDCSDGTDEKDCGKGKNDIQHSFARLRGKFFGF